MPFFGGAGVKVGVFVGTKGGSPLTGTHNCGCLAGLSAFGRREFCALPLLSCHAAAGLGDGVVSATSPVASADRFLANSVYAA